MSLLNMFMKQDELVYKVKASPFFWRQKAEELKFAAEILWPHAEERLNKTIESVEENSEFDINSLEPDTFYIFLSLLGFSTEGLFIGVITRDYPSYVSNGKLSSKLITHDLIELSMLAKLSLSPHEKIFCKQAYKAIMFESRYPIPKDNSETDYSMEIGGHCKDVFTSLYNRLYPTLGHFNKTKKSWHFFFMARQAQNYLKTYNIKQWTKCHAYNIQKLYDKVSQYEWKELNKNCAQ